jgi:hypothetical protein
LKEIIFNQFSAWGTQPWFILDTPGETSIKKDWESKHFIKKIYLPNCLLVGPKHTIESLMPHIIISDNFKYENKIVTDEKFVKLRKQFKNSG